MTAERFPADPFYRTGGAPDRMYKTGDLAKYWPDGTIEFLGRRDQQVKVRGFRIELGEVEATLAKHPAVDRVAVVVAPAADGEKELVAYAVPNPDAALEATELRRFLRDRLPDYLVPAHVVVLAALPLTANGKVDRKALPAVGSPAVGASNESESQPKSATEAAIAAVWRDVLGLAQIGVHDNFFELGGHSLKAAQVVSQIRHRLGRELPLAVFFRTPTVSAAARALQRLEPAPADIACVPAGATRTLAGATQRQIWFLNQLGQDSDVYNIAYTLTLSGRTDRAALVAALAGVVARHGGLRTTFDDAGGQLCQIVHPPTPIDLPVTDLTDRPDKESAVRELCAAFARAIRFPVRAAISNQPAAPCRG